jgi:hypothetical protein
MAKYDVILNIKIDQELKNCLENLADEQDMTASAVVREILQSFFKKKNNLNEKQCYYYDHLLNEIINNKERLDDIEFTAKFGTNPSIATKTYGESEKDIVREYIINLLQNKDISIKNDAIKELVENEAFTVITPPQLENEILEDIENGLNGKIFEEDDKNDEFKIEINFKENQDIDLNNVQPRKVIKKPIKH